jgi:hypothetical protein
MLWKQLGASISSSSAAGTPKAPSSSTGTPRAPSSSSPRAILFPSPRAPSSSRVHHWAEASEGGGGGGGGGGQHVDIDALTAAMNLEALGLEKQLQRLETKLQRLETKLNMVLHEAQNSRTQGLGMLESAAHGASVILCTGTNSHITLYSP